MIDPLTASMVVKTATREVGKKGVKEVGKRVAKELGRQALREGTDKAIDATESESLTKIRKPIEDIANAATAKEVPSANVFVGEKVSKCIKNGPEDILFALDKTKIGPFTRNASIHYPLLRNSEMHKSFDCVFTNSTTGEKVFAKELPPSSKSNPISEVLRLAQSSNSEKGIDRLGLVLPTENKTAINALSAWLADLRLNPRFSVNGKVTLIHFDKPPLSPQIADRIQAAGKELGKKIEGLEREAFIAELRNRLAPLYQELCNNAGISKINMIKQLCVVLPQWGTQYFSSEPRIMFIGRATNGGEMDLNANLLRDPNCIKEGLKWIKERWIKTDEPWHGSSSAFWRVTRALTEKYHINDWNEHIAYSNLYKVSPKEGGNPSTTLKKLQHETSQKILKTELEMLKPQVIVMQTGLNGNLEWGKDFYRAVVGDVQCELFSHGGKTIKVFRGNNRLLIVCDRPERKSETPLVECIHAAIEKYK